jgi:hypothetical protein
VQLNTTLCSFKDTTAVKVENVTNLAVVQLEIRYDPSVVQVIDADASQRGVQVRVADVFATDSIFQNHVDTRNGRIFFGAGLIGVPPINGSSGLLAIDWRPQRVGVSTVTLHSVTLTDANGQPINATVQNGTVNVDFVVNCLLGSVSLQGRTDHSGVTVTNAAGDQTVTAADGTFAIPASQSLRLEFSGYLPAEINLQPDTLAAAQSAEQPFTLEPVTLLAGDVNPDNQVNIFDLTLIAKDYDGSSPLADLNGDGRVDILDLSLVAGNYQQQGPLIFRQ